MEEALRRRRRSLHRIPEIMFDLPDTRAYVKAELSKTRAAVLDAPKNCVLAYFDAGAAETVAFRADMDALPVWEATGAEYASANPGRMHACGHDGHMAILLGLADFLSENQARLRKNILLIFQSAEESGGGGGILVDSGALDAYRVSRVYALHVDPELPKGVLACRSGAFMARSAEVHAKITGRAAHVARYREGIDSLAAGARLLNRFYAMEAALPIGVPRLLKFGMMASGTAVNVLSGETTLGGTMRAYDDTVFENMREGLLRIADSLARETGAEVALDFSEGYPALINDDGLYRAFRSAISGMAYRELPEPSLLSEDFAFYARRYPALMFRVGVGPGAALHASTFDLDETALMAGLTAMIRLAEKAMEGET